jgi:fructose/tagatose bisphosphate aldolase
MLHRIGSELYIRNPKYSKKAFAMLHAQKDSIEAELGQLDWQELPHGCWREVER